jgi:hypothetical protein
MLFFAHMLLVLSPISVYSEPCAIKMVWHADFGRSIVAARPFQVNETIDTGFTVFYEMDDNALSNYAYHLSEDYYFETKDAGQLVFGTAMVIF